ncbi:MAG: carboxylesterase family protein, partial [Myxococcales bacterium]|nr:carboxylesterase family protein [Myxococcales bacterium]
RPVMVFIHGGGNVQGSAVVGFGDQVLYDGQALAAKHGVVVVTLQYRLGPLAWLVHPALADAEGRSGNLGTLDQIAALQWVRANIGAFGGDPDHVTIFGESAGGRNVCVLKASPLARGLFHRAIMQSGACVVPARDRVEADSLAQIEAAGCAAAPDVAACLRELPAETLWTARPPVIDLAGGGSSALQPHVDGHTLTGQPVDVIAAGDHNPGPFIVGANAHEIARFAPPLRTAAAYEAAVRAALGPVADAALALYPADAYDSPRDAYVQLASDAQFVCTARAAARAAAAAGDPTFLYHFAQPLTQSAALRGFGAYHGIELFFVWDNLRLAGYQPSPAEAALAEAVGGYWTAFAEAGDPRTDGAVAWPPYGPATDEHLLLVGDGIAPGAGLKQAECDFWDRVGDR